MKAKLSNEEITSHADVVKITKSKEFGEQAEAIEFTVTLTFLDPSGRSWTVHKTYEEYPELEP